MTGAVARQICMYIEGRKEKGKKEKKRVWHCMIIIL